MEACKALKGYLYTYLWLFDGGFLVEGAVYCYRAIFSEVAKTT